MAKHWKLRQGWHWGMVGVTLLLFGSVALFVDLKPVVREDFFFSPKGPEFQQTAKIDKLFSSGNQKSVIAGKIKCGFAP